jgi:hypothetical protein
METNGDVPSTKKLSDDFVTLSKSLLKAVTVAYKGVFDGRLSPVLIILDCNKQFVRSEISHVPGLVPMHIS